MFNLIDDEKEALMEGVIGISELRMKHMLGVARKCYTLAQERGHDEKFARKMFMLGYLHDVGYEFSRARDEHADISYALLQEIGVSAPDILEAIKHHGSLPAVLTEEWSILSEADLTVNYNGEPCTIDERLKGIQQRYGLNSKQYINVKCLALRLHERKDQT